MIQKFAIIGHPVDHSLSPSMHNAGYRALGLKASYERISATTVGVKEVIDKLKREQFRGWNVTFPLKEAVLPYLNALSPEAERAGAVNTVLNQNGILTGFNTDGRGFIRFLEEEGFSFAGKRVTLLGAGGSAKAISTALLDYQCKIRIANRTASKACLLAELLAGNGGEAEAVSFAPNQSLLSTDLLVNTTSVGMKGEEFPFSLTDISSQTVVVDLIYQPPQTSFLRQAAKYGCKTYNGLGMLLYQGALAWEIWLEERAPLLTMKASLLSALYGEGQDER